MTTVPSQTRSRSFTVASLSAGPFEVGFRLLDPSALTVYVNGIQETDFDVAPAVISGSTDTATITFARALKAGDGVVIEGDQSPERGLDYLRSDPALVTLLNGELARLSAAVMELRTAKSRSVRFIDAQVEPGELTGDGVVIVSDGKVAIGPTPTDIAGALIAAQDILDEINAARGAGVQYEFVATAGQTVFTGADALGRDLAITELYSVSLAGSAIPLTSVDLSEDGETLTLDLDAPVLAGDRLLINGLTYSYSSDTVSYPEIAAPYSVKPWGHRWDLLSFRGAKAEIAKASGVQDWVEVLETALRSGERVNIGSGVFPVRSALYVDKGISVVDVPIDVQASADARFVFYGLSFTGGYFDLRSASAASLTNIWTPKWHGGIFDTRNLVASLEYGISIFDVFDATDMQFAGMKFIGWNSTLSTRTVDTAITTHNCPNFSIRDLAVSGVTDSGVYVSGNNDPGAFDMFADGGLIDGIKAFQCDNMITLKRWHRGALISNFLATECDNGILSSPVDGEDDNHGHSATISNGRMFKIAGRPIQITGGTGAKVSNVLIQDFGHVLASPSTPTDVASDNQIAGIDFRAVTGGSITDCTIRQAAWAGSTQATTAKIMAGIRLGRYSTTGTVYSTGITAQGNVIESVHRGILEDAGCSDNRFIDNRVKRHGTGTYAQSAVLGSGSVNIPAAKFYTATVNPASIPAGDRITVPIPAAEANKGDWVQVRLANRDAADVGVEAVVVQPFCTDGQVDVILHNQAATSADLANTVFEALVRPTI